ncbi:MAG: hypothetical protein WHV44_10975 [Anaerolineales bacterium]
MSPFTPTLGLLAFLGSGETSLAGGRIFEHIARRLPPNPRIVVLETPAGFELNSPQVAGRVADYLATRLQNYRPRVDVIPARKRGTPYSPDDPEICAPLIHADFIFMGPGSPTYAVRQLQNSLAWELIRARHRMGAALVFASAATIAVGARALPVYEIYKVGQDVHVVPGLNFFWRLRRQNLLHPALEQRRRRRRPGYQPLLHRHRAIPPVVRPTRTRPNRAGAG